MEFLKRKSDHELSESQIRMAERMASGLLSIQRRLAERINTRLHQVPIEVLAGVLLCLGIAFGIYCGYLLLSVFL